MEIEYKDTGKAKGNNIENKIKYKAKSYIPYS